MMYDTLPHAIGLVEDRDVSYILSIVADILVEVRHVQST